MADGSTHTVVWERPVRPESTGVLDILYVWKGQRSRKLCERPAD